MVTEIWVILWIRIDWGIRCCICKVEHYVERIRIEMSIQLPLTRKSPNGTHFCSALHESTVLANTVQSRYYRSHTNTANLVRCQSGINNRHIQCANLVVLISSNHNYALSIIHTCYNIQSIPISTQNSQQNYEYKLYQSEHCKTPSAFT